MIRRDSVGSNRRTGQRPAPAPSPTTGWPGRPALGATWVAAAATAGQRWRRSSTSDPASDGR
ncbi:MAG: hypothetical protein FJ396_06360 [Verrucomicrobia bacterium]|nr:hypothetical protein [Verrucomicrobiota bacterium]